MRKYLSLIFSYADMEPIVVYLGLINLALGAGISLQYLIGDGLTLQERASSATKLASLSPGSWGVCFIFVGLLFIIGILRAHKNRSKTLILGCILNTGIYIGRVVALAETTNFSSVTLFYVLNALISVWIIWRVALKAP